MPYSPLSSSLGVSIAAFALVLALSACPKKDNPSSSDGAPAPGVAASSGASMSEAEKLNLYIKCYNRADGAFHRSLERYASWVKNMDTGPTGKESLIYGLYSVSGAEECQKAVSQAKGMSPAMPELEQAGAAYAASLGPLQTTLTEAHTYYDRESYKDDGFAKGKALHPTLIEQANTFMVASRRFSEALEEANDVLQLAELQRMEKEGGRDLIYFHRLTMIQAKELLRLLLREEVDTAKAGGKIDAFDKAIEEMEKAPGNKPVGWSSYKDGVEDFLKAAKELWRRQRDKTPYKSGEKMLMDGGSAWMVDGTPDKLLKKYNAMVDASNRLR